METSCSTESMLSTIPMPLLSTVAFCCTTKLFCWAASAILGAATMAGVLTVAAFSRSVRIGLPLSAGVTLYVAASDLVPEVNKEPGIGMALVVFLGVGMVYLLHYFFH